MKYTVEVLLPPIEEAACTCYVCQEFRQVEREVDWEIVNTRWQSMAKQMAAALVAYKHLLVTNEWLESVHLGDWIDIEFQVNRRLSELLGCRYFMLTRFKDPQHNGTMVTLHVPRGNNPGDDLRI
jgi:hypothetical protein